MKKSFMKLLAAMFMISTLAVFVSCSDDDDTEPAPTQSVWEIVESTDNLSALERELISAGLQSAIEGANGITLFAPTDAALQQLLNTLQLEDFSSVNQDIAQAVLTYHVGTSQLASTDVVAGTTIATLQGEAITVEDGPSLVTGATSPSSLTMTDIQATNGVIHIIDVVMIPPTIGGQIVATLGTLAQPVLLGADFTILAEGIAKADAANPDAATAGIVATLIAGQDLTVFAPTNATFEGADPPITVDTFDAATWDAIIRNHVVVGQGGGTDDGVNTLGPDDLTTGATYNTAGGGVLQFFNNTDLIPASNGLGIFIDGNQDVDFADQATFMNFDAEVALPDAAFAGNGRIHVIAGVLSPL